MRAALILLALSPWGSEPTLWRFLFYRQQIPYDCQSRNHGLLACISSCLRFTAVRSLAVIGLVSGTSKMRSSHSISAMVCSASILDTIYQKCGKVNAEMHLERP